MKSTTYLKDLRIPPKKLRFYLDQVKKMTPNEALKHLYYGKQRSTQVLYKSIQSAVANAVSALKTTSDLLKFELLTVEEGQTLKRYLPGARGNVKPIKKHMSHVKIVLISKEAAKPVQKIEEKKETEAKKPELKIKKSSVAKSKDDKTVVKSTAKKQ
ncbi:MAG: large ribosomal subunit protein uL22 [Patescibacteria group bacterium]